MNPLRGRLRLLAPLLALVSVLAAGLFTAASASAATVTSAAAAPTTCSSSFAAGVVAREPENRVKGFLPAGPPRTGVSTSVSPNSVRGFDLFLRLTTSGVTVFVNGNPINLMDPSGHGACAGNGTGSCQPARASGAQTAAADSSAQGELATYGNHWVQSGTPFAHLDNNTDQCIQGCDPRTLLFADLLNLGRSKTMFAGANYVQNFEYDSTLGTFVCKCDGTNVAFDGTGFVRVGQAGAVAGLFIGAAVPSGGSALIRDENAINSVLAEEYSAATDAASSPSLRVAAEQVYTSGGSVVTSSPSTGASDAAVEVTVDGERFVRVGASAENLGWTFDAPGGTRAGTYAFPEETFNEIGADPAALKSLGDLPGDAPTVFRILEPPAGTPIQRGIVPGGEFGGEGGVPEVLFPSGF